MSQRGIPRRQFLSSALAGLGAAFLTGAALESPQQAQALSTGAPPLPPTPGPARPWHPPAGLGIGHTNLASGNAHGAFPLFGWSGRGGGLAFTLFYNSQSSRTSPLGPKWSHSYRSYLLHVPNTQNVVWVQEDGSETLFTSTPNGYVPSSGCYDQLFLNADGSWTVVRKGGLRYGFSNTGWLQSITDRNGNTTTLSYNSATLLTGVTDASGRSLRLSYDGSGRLASVTDCVGRVWSCQYDTSNRVTTVLDPPLNGQTYGRMFSYDTSNNLVSYTNRLSKQWTYTYSSNGVLTGETTPTGIKSGSGSYRAIAVQSQTMAQVISDSSSWPSGTVVVASWTDANNNTTQYGMDSQGRLLGIVDALGNQQNFGYDANNNLTSFQLPLGNPWQWTYNSLGLPLTEIDPVGNQIVKSYGNYGELLSETDPLGNTISYSYDSTGNLLSITDPLGNALQFSCDSFGQVIEEKDATGRSTQYAYDTYGNQVSITDALGNTLQQQYDLLGHVVKRIDASGRVTEYTYDNWGQLIQISYPTSGAPGVSYSYDAEGRLIQATDVTGVRTYAYDDDGRPIHSIDPQGVTSAGYDAVGRLLSQQDVTGRTISYAYDNIGRLTNVSDGVHSSQTSYAFDIQNQLYVQTDLYSNGIQRIQKWDVVGRLVNLSYILSSTGAVLVSYQMRFDAAGNLVQITEQPSGAITTYQYDAAGRLVQEQRTGDSAAYTTEYQWDASGRRVHSRCIIGTTVVHDGTYSYDAAGRLVEVVDAATGQTEVYTWDANGRLTSHPGPGYLRRYDYDDDGNLLRIWRDYGGGNVQLAYEYAYGFDGIRRWRKDYIQGQWWWYPCGVVCNPGELVIKQSDLTGQTWATLGLYTRSDVPFAYNDEYPLFDPNGNCTYVTDTTGAILSQRVYDRCKRPIRVQDQAIVSTPLGAVGVVLYDGDEDLLFSQQHGTAEPLIRCRGVKPPNPCPDVYMGTQCTTTIVTAPPFYTSGPWSPWTLIFSGIQWPILHGQTNVWARHRIDHRYIWQARQCIDEYQNVCTGTLKWKNHRRIVCKILQERTVYQICMQVTSPAKVGCSGPSTTISPGWHNAATVSCQTIPSGHH